MTNQITHSTAYCPALMITAPASGHGKTALTAGLARYYANAGCDVRVFKIGPDFLDPMVLQRASGNPVYQLDLWMTGEQECRALLHEAAQSADLILVEGVMGLFDGDPSSADLAQTFGIPLVAVIDASAMAGTFGALAHGLSHYRPRLPWAGVLANRVAGDYHAALLRESLQTDCQWLGAIVRDDKTGLPSRHLGLVQAEEVHDLDARLDALANHFKGTPLAALPPAVAFDFSASILTHRHDEKPLAGTCIAVARDQAFAFIYPANIRLLESLGARLVYFSPLTDNTLPRVDSVFLPGGYPELHLEALSANHSMRASIENFATDGGRIYAECGGMLYLLESLQDKAGHTAAMLGLLPGRAMMQNKLVSLGMQSAALPGGEWRGHTFHHSSLQMQLPVYSRGRRQRKNKAGYQGEAVYRHQSIIASYIHAYFPSDPGLAVRVFS